jgi:alkylated DNA repair dioxygenase AlkB
MESYLDDRVRIYRSYFDASFSDAAFIRLENETRWLTRSYDNDGHVVHLPRLTANYGERSYDYSGLTFVPEPWTPFLSQLKQVAEDLAGQTFNALILQLYRDGNDRVNWHSDDDSGVGINPVIVSMSFGETRAFWLRHKTDHDDRTKLELHCGDVLIMQGDLQHTYVHKVPKEKDKGPRINLTFRLIRD